MNNKDENPKPPSNDSFKQFPPLNLFKSALHQKTVTPQKVIEFKKWLAGPKCTPEAKVEGEKLLLEFQNNSQSANSREGIVKAPDKKFSKSYQGSSNTQEKGSSENAASAEIIGSPFHNPYTFIPFPDDAHKPKRQKPTPLTIDEIELDRKSGVLQLEITTISPLLCTEPKAESELENHHKVYKAHTIGNDVVMPASSVRGSLRTLMTILTGGTLGYLDEDLWLCQARDVTMGPTVNAKNRRVFLAEVVKAGNSQKGGTILLGETKLVKYENLIGSRVIADSDRQNKSQIWVDNPESPQSRKTEKDAAHQWRIKLSGRPIKLKGKKEGAFKPNGHIIHLGTQLWRDYQGRNRHSIQKDLKNGDLVWLEPMNPDAQKIEKEADIKSLQWARWGRGGIKLEKALPKYILPDSMQDDGMVDLVTDLFGQINLATKDRIGDSFAARVRPHNLIFKDGANQLEKKVTLAVLSSPHPGCVAFYRKNSKIDELSKSSPLSGYKVYRNTKERGPNAPWYYSEQGVYDDQGQLKMPQAQSVNKTADLVKEGVKGKLSIAFRSLNEKELAILLMACAVDWKLGGGKPLGLGHCRVTNIKLINEDGTVIETFSKDSKTDNLLELPEKYKKLFSEYTERIQLYQASQKPIDKLRYPRAVNQNTNKNVRAGLAWFSRHASPKKTGHGLETIWTQKKLAEKAGRSQIKAQPLPPLSATSSQADLLFGYDCVATDIKEDHNKKNLVGNIEPFQASTHKHEHGKSGGNTSQNKNTREDDRRNRQ